MSKVDLEGSYWTYIVQNSETEVIEETSEGTRYSTTIIYDMNWIPILGCRAFGRSGRRNCVVSFEYIITNNGIVKLDNKQPSASLLNVSSIRGELSEEIIDSAKNQIADSLSLRTKYGISSEIHLHYLAYSLFSSTIKIDLLSTHAEISDMGGAAKDGIGYDSNASFFERIFGWVSNIFK